MYKFIKNSVFLGAIYIILFMNYGCAKTIITSLKDKDFSGKNFSNVLVICNLLDYDSRMLLEKSLASYIIQNGGKSITSLELLPSISDLSDDKVIKIINDNYIDGILKVDFSEADKKIEYLPGQSSTIYYKGFSSTMEFPGGYISKLRVKFDINLIDTLTGKSVWASSSVTGGNAFANLDTLITSLADTTAKKLKKDGLIGIANSSADDKENDIRALMFAAKRGQSDKLRSLLDKKLDPNYKTIEGIPPLFFAVANGHYDTANILLEKGGDANFKTPKGVTILMTAIDLGDINIAKLLIDKGADVNYRDPGTGSTALMYAVDSGRDDIVRVMIEKGADINAKTISGNVTAMDIARRKYYKNIITILEKAGAK